MRQEITLDFAKNVMREQIKERRENITLEDIINRQVSEFTYTI